MFETVWSSRRHVLASGAAVLAMLSATACVDTTGLTQSEPASTPAFDLVPAPVITRVSGVGELGSGEPISNGVWKQSFDFNVGLEQDVVGGTFDYTDYSVIKEDGEPARLRVSPDDSGTTMLTYTQVSATCVEFTGRGRLLNTNELLLFEARACDNGDPGLDVDAFTIRVPERLITHGGTYQRGPDVLSGGDIEASTVEEISVGITDMEGAGQLGSGEPLGEGIWLQEFTLDAGLMDGVAEGELEFIDHSAPQADGQPARLRVGPETPGTAIATFVQVSSTCVDVSGTASLVNTGELLRFRLRACDNGEPGVNFDVFTIWVPDHAYQRGPDVLSDGELVRSVIALAE